MIDTSLDKPGRLANKIAVITGSSSGIGRAIALAFASEGASIVCSDLREEVLKLGAKAIFVKCDTSSSDNIQALIQKAVMEFGRVDIMVNNAGITLEMGDHDFRPVWEYEETVFEKTMDVNIKGVFLGIKYASKQMIVQEPGPNGDRGWIINLASVFGLNGVPGVGEFIFCSTTWVTFSASLDEAIIFATGLFNTN
jgi:NAD(P)-dependent dehydrogenase (short-subunit alcohol dehydrogenase family)